MDGYGARLPPPRLPGLTSMGSGFGHDIDELDRKIAVALQMDGRASWTSIAAFVGAPVSTVSRRGQQLLADGVVTVGVTPTLGSEGPVQSFFVLINTTPGKQLAVAERLAESPHVRFITLVTGKLDLIAEVIISGDPSQVPDVLTTLQRIDGIERWSSDLLMHTYKVSFDWGRQLYEAHAASENPETFMPSPNTCEPSHFDDTDRAILSLLQCDGRASFRAIAEQIGTNESSVRRRFERMRADGCVTTVTLVPALALGMGAETLIRLRVSPARLHDVASDLASHAAVRFLAASLGENSLWCELILPSTELIHEFVTGTIGALEGVEGWSAYMELVFIKRGFMRTRWWRGQLPTSTEA